MLVMSMSEEVFQNGKTRSPCFIAWGLDEENVWCRMDAWAQDAMAMHESFLDMLPDGFGYVAFSSVRHAQNCNPSIDLHFEALLDEDDRYSSYDKLNLQIKRFREFINSNLEKRKTKVLIIHGVGEGRLKGELKALIYKNEGFVMQDANYSPNGVGASYIEITLSKAQPI